MQLTIQHTWDGNPIGADEVATVTVTRESAGLRLQITAPHHHDPLPEHGPGSVPGLWEYEVVELFLAGPGNPTPYLEVEVGPGAHHLVLTLLGVRNAVRSGLPIELTVTSSGSHWHADARIADDLLPPEPWAVNATATHGQGDERRYLSAVPLPGDAPDFHQPGAFLPFRKTPSPPPAS